MTKSGRSVGSRNTSMDQISKIVELSQDTSMSRSEIADEVGVSVTTVYHYQKKFNIL